MEIATKLAPIALALIMFGLGTSLTLNDFARVVKQPRDFLVGSTCQLVLLPIVAYTLIKTFNTPAELALGVMIIAAAPGGVTSNVLTKFCNGDVALSISLTAIISLISIITVPFIVFKSADLLGVNYITKEVSIIGISLKMFMVVTLPVAIGMIMRKVFTNFIISNTSLIQRTSLILFIGVFFSIWIEELDRIISYIYQAGVISLSLNISMMILSYYIAKFFATGIKQRKCIALESGLQNGTLALFVATNLFDNIIHIVPTAAYALIMFVTSIIFVLILRNVN